MTRQVLRILFSTYESKGISGSYIRSTNLAKGIVKNGHHVTVVCSNSKTRLLPKITTIKSLSIIEAPGILPYKIRHAGFDPIDLVYRTVLLLTTKFDVVHCFGHRPVVQFPVLLAHIFKKFSYWTDWADVWGNGGIADTRVGVGGRMLGFFDTVTERLAITWANNVTVINQTLEKKAHFWRRNRPVFRIGVGITSPKCDINQAEARKKLKLPLHQFICAYVYVATYDLPLLIEILQEAHELNFKLLLIGPINTQLNSKLSKKLRSKIIQTGTVDHDQLATWLHAADITLLPYHNSPINNGRFPNKIGDYLGADKPFITNPTSPVKEFVEEYQVGWLVDESSQAFADKIAEIQQHPTQISTKVLQIIKVKQKLSWEQLSQQLITYYQAVL